MEHAEYMAAALELARESAQCGEVPVGCVVTDRDGHIIGKGRNRREAEHSAVAHAEVEAIDEACRALGTWRLDGCSLYVTLEPCPMCSGAILLARVGSVYYGAKEPTLGSCGSVINLFMERYGYSPKIVGGILEDECARVLTDFFKNVRR